MLLLSDRKELVFRKHVYSTSHSFLNFKLCAFEDFFRHHYLILVILLRFDKYNYYLYCKSSGSNFLIRGHHGTCKCVCS